MLKVLFLVTIALVNLVLALPVNIDTRSPEPVITQRQFRFDPGVGLFPRTRGSEFAKQLITSLQNHPGTTTTAPKPPVANHFWQANNRKAIEKEKEKPKAEATLPVIKGETTKAHQVASEQIQQLLSR